MVTVPLSLAIAVLNESTSAVNDSSASTLIRVTWMRSSWLAAHAGRTGVLLSWTWPRSSSLMATTGPRRKMRSSRSSPKSSRLINWARMIDTGAFAGRRTHRLRTRVASCASNTERFVRRRFYMLADVMYGPRSSVRTLEVKDSTSSVSIAGCIAMNPAKPRTILSSTSSFVKRNDGVVRKRRWRSDENLHSP
jgi:hypothetical protein